MPSAPIPLRKGQHVGLISLETYLDIQERLNGKARLPVRQNVNADFPLRGFVTCGDCNHPLTANWSKGRYAHYPYYLCRTKGCTSAGKSIPRAKVEDAFDDVLRCLTPSQKLLLNEKIATCGHPLPGYDETLRTGLKFLASPCKL